MMCLLGNCCSVAAIYSAVVDGVIGIWTHLAHEFIRPLLKFEPRVNFTRNLKCTTNSSFWYSHGLVSPIWLEFYISTSNTEPSEFTGFHFIVIVSSKVYSWDYCKTNEEDIYSGDIWVKCNKFSERFFPRLRRLQNLSCFVILSALKLSTSLLIPSLL